MDWEAASIGSLASFSSGAGISVAALRQESSDVPIPVYGGNGIAGYTSKPLVQEAVVVVGRVGQKCGEVYLTTGAAWITDNALYPRSFHRKVDVRFLAFALQASGLNDVKNRNDLPLITQAIMHSVRIALPVSGAEQEAIAEALSDADALIESLEHLIAKKRHLKQGAMQDLLRPKSGWVTTKLGTLGTFLKGCGVKKDECQSGEIPCVRYGEIYTKHTDYIKTFHSWISRDVAVTAKSLKAGDILFAGSGETKEEIGKCVAFVNDVEAYAGGDIVILRPADSDSLFLGYYLNTAPVNSQKASRGQGDAVVHIGSAALADIDVAIPSKREQSSIAAILSDMDTEIAELGVQLAKARQLKQGMMQELLTGRIRLA